MLSAIFPFLYGLVVLVLLWQAFKVMGRGYISEAKAAQNKRTVSNSPSDRTGQVTIHPELLDKEGRITDEELLTVRFSEDLDLPPSSETSAE